MNKSLMKRWVKALRSGVYTQGTEYLSGVEGPEHGETVTHCCLGVLCEISDLPIAVNQDSLLTDIQVEKLGLKSDNGQLNKPYKTKQVSVKSSKGVKYGNDLATLNDAGLTFKQIALIIERNYEDL